MRLTSLWKPFRCGVFARTMLVLSLLAASVFWATAALAPFPGRWFIKGLAIASLAVIVWRQRRSAQEIWLAAALLCHSAGDMLLEVERTQLFLPAVATFFCGHVLYIKTFWQNIVPLPKVAAANKILVAAIMLFALKMGKVLLPHLPENLALPIVLYMFAIGAMAATAVLAGYSARAVAAGALLYLISDALIGIDTFVRPLARGTFLIWPAYYAGQLLIALGFLQSERR